MHPGHEELDELFQDWHRSVKAADEAGKVAAHFEGRLKPGVLPVDARINSSSMLPIMDGYLRESAGLVEDEAGESISLDVVDRPNGARP